MFDVLYPAISVDTYLYLLTYLLVG